MIIGTPKLLITKLLDLDQDKRYQITEYHDKRGLRANSYYWELIGQLADKLHLGNEELHFNMLKEYSQVMLVSLPPAYNPKGFFKYYLEYARGTIKGKEVIQYKVYKPSSEMDSKQFNRLLKGLEEECRLQHIDVLEDLEVKRLIEDMEMSK